jgi:hypothetical protein
MSFVGIEQRVVHEVLTRELKRATEHRARLVAAGKAGSGRALAVIVKIAALESALSKLAGEQQPLQFGGAG